MAMIRFHADIYASAAGSSVMPMAEMPPSKSMPSPTFERKSSEQL
jgi:hypothetical protein